MDKAKIFINLLKILIYLFLCKFVYDTFSRTNSFTLKYKHFVSNLILRNTIVLANIFKIDFDILLKNKFIK